MLWISRMKLFYPLAVLAVSIALLFCFFGCFFRPYEFYPAGGETGEMSGYRLNRLTGNLVLVLGDEMIEVGSGGRSRPFQRLPETQPSSRGGGLEAPIMELLLKQMLKKKSQE